MSKVLVVAEKPSVGRDIARVLGVKGKGDGFIDGQDYVVSWAVGHLVTLCEPDEMNPAWKRWTADTLPMLPDTLPTKVISGNEKQFHVLKRLMNDAAISRVICATDSGREGELIFRYIYDQARCTKPVDRLWISSMTDAAIRDGFAALKSDSEYDGLYTSAKCRSEADWLVGMNASRAYTIKYDALLSVGRVQTPTLALLAARDREIAAFVPRDYWEIRANFGDYTGLWQNPESKDGRCFDEQLAKAIAARVRGQEGTVISNVREKKRQPPPQLYDLTSLQREANKLLGLSAAKTLDIAQALYEKHKLITYPRTDSRCLPQDMTGKVHKVINTLPEPWANLAQPLRAMDKLPHPKRVYDDTKVSDHHALVPTGNYTALNRLTDVEHKIFDLIARRLIAVHYPDYEYESAVLTTQVGQDVFRTTGTTPINLGWKAVYPDMDKSDDEGDLPNLPIGAKRTVKGCTTKKQQTKPPQHHTDGTLLQAMETAGRTLEDESLRDSMKENGLGTPATRAAIIERLIQVGYAQRKGKVLVVTDKGDRLISVAPDELTSPIITGRWEKSLSQMAKERDPAAMQAMSDRFMQGIRKFSAFLVEQALNAATDVTFDHEDRKPGKGRRRSAAAKVTDVGTACPLCNQGHVTENSKAFSCSRWRQGCKLTIWKNCLESSGGPTLTGKLVKLVIEKRTVIGSTGTITYVPGEQPKFKLKIDN